MQNTLAVNAPNDARRNADKSFERRANHAQKKAIERTLATPIKAESGVIESMFEDARLPDENGQISIF